MAKRSNIFPILAGGAIGLVGYMILTRPADAEPDPDPSGEHTVTVRTVDPNGSEIPGLFVVISDSAGVIVEGESPQAVNVPSGTEITVNVQNFENNVFSYWEDTLQTDRTRTFVVNSSVELIGIYSVTGTPIPPPPSEGEANLIVRAVDQNGDPLGGVYTTIVVNGSLAEDGFTPLVAQLPTGTSATIGVQNFTNPETGQVNTFTQWTDGVSTNQRDVTINADTTLTAIFNVGMVGDPDPSPNLNTLTVNSYVINTSNPVEMPITITNLETAEVINTVTPFTIEGTEGDSFEIEIHNTSEHIFEHWGNNSSNSIRTETLGTVPITATAYVSAGAPPEGTVQLTVSSQDATGATITGIFNTLYDSNGLVAGTGFTPTIYNIAPDTNYEISVADFETSIFSHWSDGVTQRRRSINIANATTLTAVFNVG